MIFLLEDNPARLERMLRVLAKTFPGQSVHVEDDAMAANEWLKLHQGEVDLISLDHDLDSVPRPNDPPGADHGCGRDVADFLAKQEPTCPVIVHTTNREGGLGMVMELKGAKWPVFRVYPHDSHEWVDADWAQTLTRLKQGGWIST